MGVIRKMTDEELDNLTVGGIMTDEEFENFVKVCLDWEGLKLRRKIMKHVEKLDLALLEKVSDNVDRMSKAINIRFCVRSIKEHDSQSSTQAPG